VSEAQGETYGERLRNLAARAHGAHGVHVDEQVFTRYLAARLPAEASPDQLAALHADDLYLACACATGVPGALEAFDRRFLGNDLDRALSRISTAGPVVEEVRQQLRVKLFVGERGRPGKITDYTGRGPLGGWVRVAAVRTALNLVTRQGPDTPATEEGEPLLGVADPETEYLKTQHRAEFEQAFRLALTTLSIEQRQLLRLHYVDGLTLAQIGRLRQVHESTISRRLLAARDQLLGETRRALSTQLHLGQAEVDSLMGRVMSRADVTLSTLFRSLPG
jgi:RNA polymerase sigma-70 factor, ECF subfamily